MNYSGMNYTLGLGVASVGTFFPLVSAFLGWVAVFLSGSDMSGNALAICKWSQAAQSQSNPDGRHEFIGRCDGEDDLAAKYLDGGVATTELKGKESVVFAKTFKHSILLTVLLGVLAGCSRTC